MHYKSVFISYSHDSPEHDKKVYDFVNRLKKHNTEIIIDVANPNPSEGWPRWMVNNIHKADFVFMIYSEFYKKKMLLETDLNKGIGVKWESMIIMNDIYSKGTLSTKYIPIILEEADKIHIPTPFNGLTFYNVSDSDQFYSLMKRIGCVELSAKSIALNLTLNDSSSLLSMTNTHFSLTPKVYTDEFQKNIGRVIGEKYGSDVYILICNQIDYKRKILGNDTHMNLFDHIIAVTKCFPTSSDGCLLSFSFENKMAAIFNTSRELASFAFKLKEITMNTDWISNGFIGQPFFICTIAKKRGNEIPMLINTRLLRTDLEKIHNLMTQPVLIRCEKSVSRELRSDYVVNTIDGVDFLKERSNENSPKPLKDFQYYLRETVVRKFAFLWLVLDQLPTGSWGKSVFPWMKNVWKGCPDIKPNSFIEDEGGFETTILNMSLLFDIIGEQNFYKTQSSKSLKYLRDRQDEITGEFGPLSPVREGSKLQVGTRHTALAVWFLGKFLIENQFHNEQCNQYKKGFRAIFINHDKESILQSFQKDRNPVLTYVVCWQIIHMVQSTELSNLLEAEEIALALDVWNYVHKSFVDVILKSSYRPIPCSEVQEVIVEPFTIPYSSFTRMEMYSFLTAAQFLDKEMPIEVLGRFWAGIQTVCGKYLETTLSHSTDGLRTPIKGIYPFVTSINDENAYPDIGVTSLLLSVLRSFKFGEISKKFTSKYDFNDVIYQLLEDISNNFDKYLIQPSLYSLTNAGMFATFMSGDNHIALQKILAPVKEQTEKGFPDRLNLDTEEFVLSEQKINELLKDVVEVDNYRVQVATFSLSRLILDYVRPGRYITEEIKNDVESMKMISGKNLRVYSDPAFILRFFNAWGDKIDSRLIEPFVQQLTENNANSILDVGCGPGQYAKEFIKRGFSVTMLDGSQEMLDFAKKQIPLNYTQPDIIKCDVLSVNDRDMVTKKHYDAIWCSGLFAHIPKSAWGDVLSWLFSLLTDNGVLFVNVMTDNPRIFSNDGRFFTFLNKTDIFIQTLERSGFEMNQIITTSLKNNTFNEPLLKTNWSNLIAVKAIKNLKKSNLEIDEYSSILTAHAYHYSVKNFISAHAMTDSRKAYISKLIDKLSSSMSAANKLGRSFEVLDAGCGPGDHCREMLNRDWHVHGIDISPEMINYCRKIQANSPTGNKKIQYNICDIAKMPVEWTGKFNGIISVTVFHHLCDEKAHRVLQEFSRILKPGGVIHFDVQIGRERGYDPDLRFVEGYLNEEHAIERLKLEQLPFLIIEKDSWVLPRGENSYRRPIEFKFLNIWLKKIENS